MPDFLLKNVVLAWEKMNQRGASTLPFVQTIERGMGSQNGFIFHGYGNDFEKAVTMWAGLIDGNEVGATWRYVARQRQAQVPYPKSSFLISARDAAEYLGDNVTEYAGGEGMLIVEYSEERREGYVIAIDAGSEGFPLDDEGKLDVSLARGGFIQPYHGDGIALGRVIQRNDVVIISHGQVVEIPRCSKEPERLVPRNYDGMLSDRVHTMHGSVVMARWARA
ncbi:MAG: hypothetical protein PHO20_01255 [Candidatus Peribacteraceae bacterium]|nr:hypothetical protein [Candidatus Peribacteraceae bacterium]